MLRSRWTILVLLSLTLLVGCKKKVESTSDSGSSGSTGTSGASSSSTTSGAPPVFSLSWSEYPSWSVFGVADSLGIIDGKEGATGEIEKKWGVDIVLKEAGYDSCLNMFTTKNCDAVCITNMDALIASPKRDCVAVLPTSTSFGADACIVVGINNLEELKPHDVFGLDNSVSEYCFVRCIEEIEKSEQKGYKPEDFKFVNQDPAAAAVAMQQKNASHQAIMVWNPFVLQTLNDRPDAKVLFDSTKIPNEIVDMVVIGKDSLSKPGGDKFVKAVMETYYRMNQELANKERGDETLVELGQKFSKLGLEDMKKVVEQTKFYKTVDDAIKLMDSEEFRGTMKTVEKFCVQQQLNDKPSYAFETNAPNQLIFDSSFLKAWKEGN